jgi:hypothetical protein
MQKLILAILILSSIIASAIDVPVTVTWNANTEPDIHHYTVKYGTATGVYTKTFPTVAKETQLTIQLPIGTTAFLVVTATNTLGLESLPSNEVSAPINPAPTAPTAFKVLIK